MDGIEKPTIMINWYFAWTDVGSQQFLHVQKTNLSRDVCVKAMQIGCWSKLFASRRELRSTVLWKHRICNRRDKSIVWIFLVHHLKFLSNIYQVLMIGCVNFKIACFVTKTFPYKRIEDATFQGDFHESLEMRLWQTRGRCSTECIPFTKMTSNTKKWKKQAHPEKMKDVQEWNFQTLTSIHLFFSSLDFYETLWFLWKIWTHCSWL